MYRQDSMAVMIVILVAHGCPNPHPHTYMYLCTPHLPLRFPSLVQRMLCGARRTVLHPRTPYITVTILVKQRTLMEPTLSKPPSILGKYQTGLDLSRDGKRNRADGAVYGVLYIQYVLFRTSTPPSSKPIIPTISTLDGEKHTSKARFEAGRERKIKQPKRGIYASLVGRKDQ